MEPLAKWCKADFIQATVKAIHANDNKILLEDGTTVEYDVLALNVGSRTRGANEIKGVWDFSLTTRPINLLLSKI
jgi:NADH dehydrogenase FAD-containing subunit